VQITADKPPTAGLFLEPFFILILSETGASVCFLWFWPSLVT